MPADYRIGRVVSVDTAHVVIKLDRSLVGMSRNTHEDIYDVGRVNSYVIVPVAAHRLVAMVTRVFLVEDQGAPTDRSSVTLPSARRLMKAILVGTIDRSAFHQGIASFPVLGNPVHVAERADLNAIFGPVGQNTEKRHKREEPGYCIPLGESAVIRRRPIRIDPDAFFGKHAAVLGSTGSGKSCTIASLLQSIREQPEVRRTTCIILDTNGEYRTAFQNQTDKGEPGITVTNDVLYVPSSSTAVCDRLMIPYWFMDTDDFNRLFRTSKGVQRPVLLEALRLARNNEEPRATLVTLREELIHEINRLWLLSGQDKKVSKDVKQLAQGLIRHLDHKDFEDVWDQAKEEFGISRQSVCQALKAVCDTADRHTEGQWPGMLPIDARAAIRDALNPLYEKLTKSTFGEATTASGRLADAPSYFDKQKFRFRHIEQVLRREESRGARVRDFSGTMLLRIDRLLADRRFDFLFGPVGRTLPRPVHALATFLRDAMGLGATRTHDLSNANDVPACSLPFYDRQRKKPGPADIVILDLSLLAAEVLENVTALIGRLILAFLQRLGEEDGADARGSLPVVLVLEEAHNYIPRPELYGTESLSRVVFERIAREGRKFGLSLVIASQRPSELSKTVLSQCNSFIVHRLQNPDDLRYFREIVPSIYEPMLEQLPALAPQTAFVVGECVPAPALVRIRDADPMPRSHDPKFYRYWVRDRAPDVDVEDICRQWENGDMEPGS